MRTQTEVFQIVFRDKSPTLWVELQTAVRQFIFMNRLIYTISFIILGRTISIGCTCAMTTLGQLRNSEFKNSQLVLIADVLPNTGKGTTYKIKIVEILKGQTTDSVLTGKIMTSCSDFPSEGRWIIYARDLKDGAIEIRQCGLSRPISNPDRGPYIKRYLIPDRVKSLKLAQ